MTFVAPIPQGPQALQIATGYNYQSDSFYGALRLVKSPNNCYTRSYTSLFSKSDIAKANRLESAIEILAQNILEAFTGTRIADGPNSTPPVRSFVVLAPP